MKFHDSEGTELKDGDILLSSRIINPVKYKLYINGERADVQTLGPISGWYEFRYFKQFIRPSFVKE